MSETASLSGRLQFQRRRRGLTQEELAAAGGLDPRTIQRIEAGHSRADPGTIRKLAQALGVDVVELQFGVSEADLANLTDVMDQYLCALCGSALVRRSFVDHEYGDVEFEEFACGHTRGWRHRPCPKDPAFPRLEDYELDVIEEANGEFYCAAIGLTDSARAVDLSGGRGRTPEEAKRWVQRSYLEARDGNAAAEAAFPLWGAD